MRTVFFAHPRHDPSSLMQSRDSIYAADLLVTAIACLDFFTWLAGNPNDADAICVGLKLDPRPTDVMLTLLTSYKLIEKREGRFHATELAQEYLVKGSPFYLRPYFATMENRPQVKEMLSVLKTGKPACWGSKPGEEAWAAAIEKSSVAEDFTAAMDCRGEFLAPTMAEKLDCRHSTGLLDIAGGSGIYACAVVAANAGLQAAVLEKAPVDRVALKFVARKGLAHRVSVLCGDMFKELPSGYDTHLFSNVLHDWDKAKVERVLANSFRSLPPGGSIAIHDSHIDEDKSGPVPIAEYSVLLMHSTEGKCYSTGVIREMLMKVGFSQVTFTPTIAWRSLITARKP